MKNTFVVLALLVATPAAADIFPIGPAVPVPSPISLPDSYGPVSPAGGFAPDVSIWRVIPSNTFPGVACNGEIGGGCYWQVGSPDVSIDPTGIAAQCQASVAGDITHGAGIVCDAGPVPLDNCNLFQLNGDGSMTPISMNPSSGGACPSDPGSSGSSLPMFPFIAAPVWILMHPTVIREDETWRDSPPGVACITATDFAKSAGYQAGLDMFSEGNREDFCFETESVTAVMGGPQCSAAGNAAGYVNPPGVSAAFYNSCERALSDMCYGNPLRPPCSMLGVEMPPPGQDDAGLVTGRQCAANTTFWAAASYYEQCRGCCLDAGLAGSINQMQTSNCLAVCGRTFPQ